MRLHKTGGHLTPGVDILHYTFVDDVQKGDVHSFCKICWRGSFTFGAGDARAEVSGSEGSLDSELEVPSGGSSESGDDVAKGKEAA